MTKPRDLAMIGLPEKVLRYATAGVLIEEGEVSKELAMAVADGSFRLDHYPKIDGRVMHAIRKVSSVVLTLRSNGMLAEPTTPSKYGNLSNGDWKLRMGQAQDGFAPVSDFRTPLR